MAMKLDEACKHEIQHVTTTAQGLSSYVPLQAADTFVQDLEKAKLYNLHEQVLDFLNPDKNTHPLLLLQGNSGAGKSLYGRYLEAYLWQDYQTGHAIPLFVSMPRVYKDSNFIHIIQQALH